MIWKTALTTDFQVASCLAIVHCNCQCQRRAQVRRTRKRPSLVAGGPSEELVLAHEGCKTGDRGQIRHPEAAAGIPSLGRPDAAPTIVEKAAAAVVFHIGVVILAVSARDILL